MTHRKLKLTVLALLLVLASLAVALVVTAQDNNSSEVQAQIANAISAGPLIIGQHATILSNSVDADGKFIVLQEGTNGWTCFPDDPTALGNTPICYDQVWGAWFDAAAAGKNPNEAVTVPGFAYMYQGGVHASMTDPSLTQPPAGQDWMYLPPHIMIALPAGVDISGIGTDPNSGNSWVMYPGTPFEVILVPVGDMTDMPGMAPSN